MSHYKRVKGKVKENGYAASSYECRITQGTSSGFEIYLGGRAPEYGSSCGRMSTVTCSRASRREGTNIDASARVVPMCY